MKRPKRVAAPATRRSLHYKEMLATCPHQKPRSTPSLQAQDSTASGSNRQLLGCAFGFHPKASHHSQSGVYRHHHFHWKDPVCHTVRNKGTLRPSLICHSRATVAQHFNLTVTHAIGVCRSGCSHQYVEGMCFVMCPFRVPLARLLRNSLGFRSWVHVFTQNICMLSLHGMCSCG